MRLEITRKTDLAIRALRCLDLFTRAKGPELARRVGTTRAFVAQVMSPLVQRGWVSSDPGPAGGYELATDLDRLSVLEVIEAIEGPTVSNRCVLRDGPCPGADTCTLHEAWIGAREALMTSLGATAVAAAGVCREEALA
jgi:Rrf2 family protein